MEREFESKGLVSAAAFVNLINSLEVIQIRVQANTYIDTDDGYFKSQASALRLRIIDGQYIFSLKRQDQDGATEWNSPLTHQQYQQIIQSRAINLADFNCPGDDHLTDLQVVTIETKRYICKFGEHLIELDQTTFGEVIDYEIEIEADSLKHASEIMSQLVATYNLDIKKSHPKIARFYMYN